MMVTCVCTCARVCMCHKTLTQRIKNNVHIPQEMLQCFKDITVIFEAMNCTLTKPTSVYIEKSNVIY